MKKNYEIASLDQFAYTIVDILTYDACGHKSLTFFDGMYVRSRAPKGYLFEMKTIEMRFFPFVNPPDPFALISNDIIDTDRLAYTGTAELYIGGASALQIRPLGVLLKEHYNMPCMTFTPTCIRPDQKFFLTMHWSEKIAISKKMRIAIFITGRLFSMAASINPETP